MGINFTIANNMNMCVYIIECAIFLWYFIYLVLETNAFILTHGY